MAGICGELVIGDDLFLVEEWSLGDVICGGGEELVLRIDFCTLEVVEIGSARERELYTTSSPFTPSIWIFCAVSRTKNVTISSENILFFFECHKECLFITFDANKIFAILLQAATHQSPRIIEILWEIVEQGRFRDVEVLGNLYFLIEDKFNFKSLSLLIEKVTNVKITTVLQSMKNSSLEPKDIQIQSGLVLAIGTRFTWIKLIHLSNQIMDIYREEIFDYAKASYGLLTDIIQVKAKIALFFVHLRGITIDSKQLSEVFDDIKEKIFVATKELTAVLPYSRNLFQVDLYGSFVRDKQDIPEINKKRLGEVLLMIKKEIKEEDEEGNLEFNIKHYESTIHYVNVNQWEAYRKKHPFLEKWIFFERLKFYLGQAATLKEFIPKVHPNWNYLQKNGRISCSKPNFQTTPRDGSFRGLYVAREGHHFLIVDYNVIELCAFAAIAEFKYDYSMLAKVIRGNTDPHCFTAAIFGNLSLSDFLEKKNSDPEMYEQQRALAKFMNFSILSGIGTQKLQEKILISSDLELSKEQVKEFKKKLTKQVYPEMSLFLYSDTVSNWIRNLGCSLREFMRDCTFPKGSRFTKNHQKEIHRILKGKNYNKRIKWEKQLWKAFVNINRNSNLVGLLQSAYEENQGGAAVAKALDCHTICTLTGRIRRNVSWTIHNNSGFSGLAADGAKLALWNLEYSGYKVVAFIHDEFIIEMPNDEPIDLPLEIICESMSEIIKTIPIRCKYTRADHWATPTTPFPNK